MNFLRLKKEYGQKTHPHPAPGWNWISPTLKFQKMKFQHISPFRFVRSYPLSTLDSASRSRAKPKHARSDKFNFSTGVTQTKIVFGPEMNSSRTWKLEAEDPYWQLSCRVAEGISLKLIVPGNWGAAYLRYLHLFTMINAFTSFGPEACSAAWTAKMEHWFTVKDWMHRANTPHRLSSLTTIFTVYPSKDWFRSSSWVTHLKSPTKATWRPPSMQPQPLIKQRSTWEPKHPYRHFDRRIESIIKVRKPLIQNKLTTDNPSSSRYHFKRSKAKLKQYQERHVSQGLKICSHIQAISSGGNF